MKKDIIKVNENIPYEVRFEKPLGLDKLGKDYTLTLNCYDEKVMVNYIISKRNDRGFVIITSAFATVEYICIEN